MSTLLNQIDQIELKVKTLIKENKRLVGELHSVKQARKDLNKQLLDAQQTIRDGEESMEVLKTANGMLGSDDYKTKTKLKINARVREIDQCIAQLT